MIDKNRPLIIFRYLWEHTDEEHPAIIKDILSYLAAQGIHADRKTVAKDLAALQDSGFDIVCNRSRQNQYFIGSRDLELAELKIIVDAVHAAKFISLVKSKTLIDKLASLASPYQADQLKRDLYVDGKVKTYNEAVYYTVDLLHHTIRSQKAVTFRYIEYTQNKERVWKHNGQVYQFSPYDLVWNNDAYYVFGWSQGNQHDKVVKFRVDRIAGVCETENPFHEKPSEYSIDSFCRQVFSMYDGEIYTVTLLCDNSVMKDIVDRFGEDVNTRPQDAASFIAEVDVSVSQTFFAWVFSFAGKVKITGPSQVEQAFMKQIEAMQA